MAWLVRPGWAIDQWWEHCRVWSSETSASVRSGDGAGDRGDQGHEHRGHDAMVRDGLQHPGPAAR